MQRFVNLDYRLTQKVSIYGCGCKLEKLELENLLHSTGLDSTSDPRVIAGVGDDAGVTKISENSAVIQHLDFFTPIVDDPYIQGKIAACNVSSDLFAKGTTNLLGALTIIGLPEDMPEVVLRDMVKGFSEVCSSISVPIVGGQTIYCAWPIIGGAMTGMSDLDRIVYNSTAKLGDELILTKPLGIRSVMAALREPLEKESELSKIIGSDILSRAIDLAIEFMTIPNKIASETMVRIGVNACTDVTGFGILGHASTMAKRSGKVKIVIDTLPVISGAVKLAEIYHHDLLKGTSAETSGGLLIAVESRKADSLVAALKSQSVPAFHVGHVEVGSGEAAVVDAPKILEV